ncbi:MAG TPA: TldD/PmbA family protein [Acidimicrobiales bacterium]|jgi:TldD protein|nr:TldD/PmbA family protein [Acidimicrobiales bacterium]
MTTATLVEKETADHVLAEALAKGGEFAELFCEDKTSSYATMDQRKVEEIGSSHERGAGIRVVVGETTGFAHTTDLTERGLLEAARTASSIARSGAPTTTPVALGDPVAHDLRATVVPGDVPKARKIELLESADDAARAEGASVAQVMVGLGDSRRRIVVASSDGTFATDDLVRTRMNVMCVASGDTGMQTGYQPIAKTAGFELFEHEDVPAMATKAARQALTKLEARPAPTGELPVVLAGGSGGILFHEACGHGLEADAILKEASVYAGRVGELVASPLVTLVDDGTMDLEWGALEIDDEGRPAARNVLIENGVLTDYMWDWLQARKDGRRSSGNGRRESYQCLPLVRMTNTFLLAGTEDPDEIIAQTPYGIYVAQLSGGQVNTATGDFTFGTSEAYLIENGKLTAPLRDCQLIGNGPEVLSRVDAVGTDFAMMPGTCGKDGQSVPVGCGQATMRVTGMTIGGTAQ